MKTAIVIVAHAPLASALRECASHVFPDVDSSVVAVDVFADAALDIVQARLERLIAAMERIPVLVLTDMYGATPSNVAQRVVDGKHSRLVAGVNLPMLLRAVNYQREPLDTLVARVLTGGKQSIVHVAAHSRQQQARNSYGQLHCDDQQ